MKKLALFSVLIIFCALAFSFQLTAQKTGNPRNVNYVAPEHQNTGSRSDPAIFLKGTYIEVGVHESGSCGTATAPPAGYHYWTWYDGLGFVADFGRDGWDVGTPPYSGDYFVPGDPVEGWILQWTANAQTSNFVNEGLMGAFDVPQTSLTNTSTPAEQSCVWIGTATNGPDEQIEVTQVIRFKTDDLFFVFDVTLKNVGTTTLTNVEYMRNVDPDQEEDWTEDYTTSNYVQYQPGVGGNADTALVVANGLVYGIPLGLTTINPYAVVSAEGFYNTYPDEILDSPVAPSPGSPSVQDEAINLAYRFPELAPGQSITFTYAYILNQEDLGNLGTVLAPRVPVSNWAIYLALGMMILFVSTSLLLRSRKA